MDEWESNLIKQFPMSKIIDWEKSTNNQQPLKLRHLEEITIKRFENVFVRIRKKSLFGSPGIYFKTAIVVTQFGLSFVNSGPAITMGRVGGEGSQETIFYNENSYEDYLKWNPEKNYFELKLIMEEAIISEETDIPCIEIDYTSRTLFAIGNNKMENKLFLFTKDYNRLFQEIQKRKLN